jgi:hypothetical protein
MYVRYSNNNHEHYLDSRFASHPHHGLSASNSMLSPFYASDNYSQTIADYFIKPLSELFPKHLQPPCVRLKTWFAQSPSASKSPTMIIRTT